MRLSISKLKMAIVALLFSFSLVAQQSDSILPPLTPGGMFDNVYDRFGNVYNLRNLELTQHGDGKIYSAITTTCNAGYFNLYFESGSLGTTNQAANQAVICQVFYDLSNFIISPLTTTGHHVNVWVRNIAAFSPPPGVLGLATQFYTAPVAPTITGIVDGEVQKTIVSGIDSYTGVSPFLNPTGGGLSSASGVYFHSIVAFDFVNYSWNTSLTTGATGTFYDLYTTVLHEATHTLGFASLIDYNGQSKLASAGMNYYSRYDSFLKDNSGNPLIHQSGSTCTNYQYGFNSPTVSISELSPSTPTCTTDINFAGSVNQKCYTPSAYSSGSSLSHMDDPCHSPTTYSTGGYYVMSYATNYGVTKRYLQPEERLVLCNLGYNVNSVFGTSGTPSYNDYLVAACPGIGVAGVNDGIATGGNYLYTSTTSTLTIPISLTGGIAGVKDNDYNTSNISCVQSVFSTGTASIVGGNVVFIGNPGFTGAVLIRYIPQNSSGVGGNITYITGFILPGNCTPASSCNIIQNNGFENVSPSSLYQAGDGYNPYFSGTNPDVQLNCWYDYLNTPDLFTRGCNNSGDAHSNLYNLGTSTFNSTPVWDSHNPSTGNNHVLGLTEGNFAGTPGYAEAVQNFLGTPLIPGTAYQLSFWAYNYSGYISYPYPTFVVNTPMNLTVPPTAQILTIAATPSLVTYSNANFNTPNYPVSGMDILANITIPAVVNTWTMISTTFTYTGVNNDNVLFVGTNYNANVLAGYTLPAPASSYHYILLDDISLLPVSTAPTFTLPTTLYTCANNTVVTNIGQYAYPPGGTFSGPGVTYTAGVYNFDPNAAGNGLHQIVYSYTSAIGCVTPVTQQVSVSIVPMTFTTSSTGLCAGQTATLTAGGASTYTWSPGGAHTNTISITPGSTTIYTVAGTNTASCTGTNTISVIVSPTPTVSIAASSFTLCGASASTTLTASGATNYSWTPIGIFASPFTNPTVVSPTVTTTYSLSGSNPGCITVSSATVSIAVNNPFITLTPSTTICTTPGTVTLSATATGTSTYTWSPSSTLSSPHGATVTATPTTAVTVYSVSGTTGTCVITKTISITTNSVIPAINVAATPTAICVGQTVTLGASYGTFGTTNNFTWFGNNLNSNTGAAVTATPSVTSTYTVSDVYNGCTGTKTITVVVNPTPTVNISATNTLICAGSSSTLTASGASNYNWTPTTSLSCPTCSITVATPTISTTYSVIGTYSTGCASTKTITITLDPPLTVAASPSVICVGQTTTTTLTAGGATSYTWSANAGSVHTTTVSVSPISTTIYTVSGTASLGCVGSTTISIAVNPTPTITVVYSPTVICTSQTTTLTASGATTYSWSNSATTATVTGTFPNAGVKSYTVTGTSAGCSGIFSSSFTVYATPTITTLASPLVICANQSSTLTASGASTYTWSPSSSLSSPIGSTVTATPPVITTYSVSGTGTNSCVGNTTVNLIVNPVPTISVTGTPTVCIGSSTTLTASGASNYSWTPSTGLTCTNCTTTIASPTVNTTYSVTSTYSTGCLYTIPELITVIPTSCTGTPPSYTITSTGSFTNSPSLVSQNMYINSGYYTISSSDMAFLPGVSITVANTATLEINNSWLHACQTCTSKQLWQGIIVQNGGTLYLTSDIIEDAVQAVYTQSSGATTPIPNYYISGCIFNNNATGIYIDSHQGNLSGNVTYGNLFTCRNLSSHATGNIGAIQNDVLLATPLIPSTSNPLDLTLAGIRTAYGVYVNTVNVANPIIVGGTGKQASNIFDNMDYGIYSLASSLTAWKNIFQNLTGNSSSAYPIGVGIYSDATVPGHCSYGCNVRSVLIVGNSTATVASNQTNSFKSCLIGVYTNIMRQVYINDNVFSNETTATNFSTSGSYVTGQYGVYNKGFGLHSYSSDMEQMIYANNNCQNYATAHFLDFTQLNNTSSGGSAYIYNNIISGSGASNNYCSTGLYLQQSLTTGASSVTPQDAISITTNSITNIASNCINISSVGASGATTGFVTVSQNSLTVQYNAAATSLQTPPLAAVNISGSEYVKVSNNPLIGSTYSGSYLSSNAQFIEGIYVSQSPGSRITCNAVSQVGEGFVWSGTNHGSLWLENTMHNSQYGLVLRSSGIMDNQGNSLGHLSHYCGDQFGNSDISVAQTLSDASNPALTGSTSKLYNIATSCGLPSTYLPCINTVSSIPGSIAYTTSGSTVTLVPVSGSGYGLCTSEGGNGRFAADTTNTIGGVPSDSILQSYLASATPLPVYDYETHWAKQYYVNKIKPAISASNSFSGAKAFAAADLAIKNGNYNVAQSIINAVSTNNVIERNWQQVDNMMLKLQNNTLTQNEISTLQTIAAQCPLSGGSIVYKARAMLNTQFRTIFTYPNDCPVNNGGSNARTENTTGISNITENQKVNLYPNPNNGNMMLDYNINADAHLEIMDITGNLVGTYNLPTTGTTIKIQNDYLQNGMYLYRVISNNTVIKIGKIVVMQ